MRVAVASVAVLGALIWLSVLRLDLLFHGIACVGSVSRPAGEGAELVACRGGGRYRIVAQLPCSERLWCSLRLSCIDTIAEVDAADAAPSAASQP